MVLKKITPPVRVYALREWNPNKNRFFAVEWSTNKGDIEALYDIAINAGGDKNPFRMKRLDHLWSINYFKLEQEDINSIRQVMYDVAKRMLDDVFSVHRDIGADKEDLITMRKDIVERMHHRKYRLENTKDGVIHQDELDRYMDHVNESNNPVVEWI